MVSAPVFHQKNAFALTALVFAMFSVNASANNDMNVNKRAHPPYHIKTNTPSFAPEGFTPLQIQTAYGLNLVLQKGAGQTIAIIDAYDNPKVEEDLSVFDSTFDLAACTTANGCFEKMYASGKQPKADPDWGMEIALDVEWAHAIAPFAKILLVEADDNNISSLMTAIQTAITRGANVVSMSWSTEEFSTQAKYDTTFNNPTVSFTAASGDSGSGVNWPAVSPYVIAVGATSLITDTNGHYVSETAWAGSGGGISAYVKIPAYQTNFANQSNPNNMRGVPDVSLVGDPYTGVSVYDTYSGHGWLVIGGTSVATPVWAGIIAITHSASSKTLSNMNAQLYTMASTAYAADYHDIVKGKNGSCGSVCKAKKGYDYVTGLGTAVAQSLIKSIITGNNTCIRATPILTVTPDSVQTIQQNGSIVFNFTMTNNDSTACPTAYFTLTSSVNSSFIKAGLSTFALAVLPGGGQASGYVLMKAANVAVIGHQYAATINLTDTTIKRSATFNPTVVIGNSLRSL